MNIFRAIAGVVLGYVVFAFGSMILVMLVLTQEGQSVYAVVYVSLALIGLVSGWTATSIAGHYKTVAVCAVATLVLIATLANLFLQLGAEPNWFKLATLVLTIPAILVFALRMPRKRINASTDGLQ